MGIKVQKTILLFLFIIIRFFNLNLYVGNLNYRCSAQEVEELFEQFGTVNSVKLINDRTTGRPKGFGFVEMNDSDGQTAITRLNGFELSGRVLVVNIARERENTYTSQQTYSTSNYR